MAGVFPHTRSKLVAVQANVERALRRPADPESVLEPWATAWLDVSRWEEEGESTDPENHKIVREKLRSNQAFGPRFMDGVDKMFDHNPTAHAMFYVARIVGLPFNLVQVAFFGDIWSQRDRQQSFFSLLMAPQSFMAAPTYRDALVG